MLAVLIRIRVNTYKIKVYHMYSQDFKQYLHVFNTYSCEYVRNEGISYVFARF